MATTTASAPGTSLSASSQPPQGTKPHSINEYLPVKKPPHLDRLTSQTHQEATVESVTIDVADGGADGFVPGFLHLPPNFTSPSQSEQEHHRTAAVLLSGAGGGVTGPSSIYLSLASKLATLGSGIPTLRLDYRYPARTKLCVSDVLAAMQYLQDLYGLDKFVLVGWSFGGAPVFTVAGADQRVVGCATVASQTAETEGIRRLSPRPVLLMHGTGDRTLGHQCSERLYEMYGERGDRRLELFEGDNHALTGNAIVVEEMLGEFVAKCAGVEMPKEVEEEVLGVEVVDEEEREELMREPVAAIDPPERIPKKRSRGCRSPPLTADYAATGMVPTTSSPENIAAAKPQHPEHSPSPSRHISSP
ncbi:Alpha/Beta hydrolase protein [Sordaria brevicollis]|uniref:Alpha/Beta hydrolase protein n=1 Tax=Sordaria brevicollis TaxID=83679 RepID=A0AAE0PJ95_SORBR|nr:Alpha/Beta hydrolase protein [Sordaria brevicollis]